MSIKVRLYFTLVGKTTEWKRYINKDSGINWNNSDTLEYVRGLITKQFGDRPITFVNEKNLINNSFPYPHYFSAGWFVSDSGESKELVIVAHSESAEKANKLVMHHIKSIDWDNLAKEI